MSAYSADFWPTQENAKKRAGSPSFLLRTRSASRGDVFRELHTIYCICVWRSMNIFSTLILNKKKEFERNMKINVFHRKYIILKLDTE